MTENIVNFRKAKKKVLRAKKDSQASENRVKFGRTKAQKDLEKAKSEKITSHIDGHKLD